MNIFKVNKKTPISNRKLRELVEGLKPRFEREVKDHNNIVIKVPDDHVMISVTPRNLGIIEGIGELLEIFEQYSDILDFVYAIDTKNSRRKTILNEDDDFEEYVIYHVYVSKKSLGNAVKKCRENKENSRQKDLNPVPCQSSC